MATAVKTISINLRAGTVDLYNDIDRAKAKYTDWGNHVRGANGAMVSQTMAVSGGIRLLEGNLTNNIRAVEKFLAVTLKLGPAFQDAFAFVGAAASAGILLKMGEEAYKFYKTVRDASDKTADSFRQLNAPIRASTDEMRVANDRLQMDIDRLMGKRTNTLALTMDEARAATDKLFDSIEKTIGGLNKLLQSNATTTMQKIFGMVSDKELNESLGGKSGVGGFGLDLAKKVQEANTSIDAAIAKAQEAKTPGDKTAAQSDLMIARSKGITDASKIISDAIKTVNDQLEHHKDLLAESKHFGPLDIGVPFFRTDEAGKRRLVQPSFIRNSPADEERHIEKLEFAKVTLEQGQSQIPVMVQNDELTAQQQKLKSDKSNNKLDKPADIINERLILMGDKLTDLKVKFAAIGQTDTWKAQVEGITEAHKALDELAKGLALAAGKKLDANDPNASRKFLNSIVPGSADKIANITIEQKATEVEDAYKTKLHATNLAITERIASLYQLGNALNKGYEATRNASVEIELSRTFGDRYNDTAASVQSDIEKTRQQLRQAADKEHGNQSQTISTSLGDQIQLEKSLLAVQEQGAEVIARVTLAYRLRDLAQHGASALQLQQETTKFETEQDRLTKSELTTLNDKIAATKALTAAAAAGEEAQRKAGLQSKYDEMTAHGKEDLVPATKTADEAEHQLKITEEATKTANIYREQMFLVNQQIAATEKLRKTAADQVGVEIALKNLEDQRLTIAANQALAMRRAQDGVRAFFLEMQKQGESTAKIVYDSLNSAVDKLSDNLAKVMTGQKSAWKDMFKSIGTDLLKAEIKKDLSKGLGDIGKIFGIQPKLDGQSESTATFVRIVGGGPNATDKNGLPMSNVAPPDLSGMGAPAGSGNAPWSEKPPGSVGASLGGSQSGGIPQIASQLAKLWQHFHPNAATSSLQGISGDDLDALSNGGALGTGGAGDLGGMDFAGTFAGGGDIPSGSYGIAGENGNPEKVYGPAHVMNNKDSFGGGGGDTHVTYNINAPNAELGAYNRIARGIEASHDHAVSQSAKGAHERARRTPQVHH